MQFTVSFRREEHSIQNSLHRLLLPPPPPPPPCLPLLVCFLRLDPGELTSPLPLYYGKMMAEMKGSVRYMASTWKYVAILMWSCEKKCVLVAEELQEAYGHIKHKLIQTVNSKLQ